MWTLQKLILWEVIVYLYLLFALYNPEQDGNSIHENEDKVNETEGCRRNQIITKELFIVLYKIEKLTTI